MVARGFAHVLLDAEWKYWSTTGGEGGACLSSLFAIGEPRGAASFGACVGCGVFFMSARGLDCRYPPRARARVGDRPPRSTFDS